MHKMGQYEDKNQNLQNSCTANALCADQKQLLVHTW